MSDISAVLASTASRLRLVQLDFAEESQATREEYLLGELQAALNRVPHAQRQAFLRELAEYFPTWDQAAPSPKAEASPPPPPPPADAQGLAKMLMEQGQELPQQKKEELLESLRKAWGVAKSAAAQPVSAGAGTTELLGDWRGVLGVNATDAVDTAVLPQMVRMLIEFIHTLDPLVVRTWGTINPGANFARTDWQKAVTKYVRGQRDATLSRNLLELRQLTAALIGAIPQVPYRLFNQHLSRFRPEDIEEAVRIEGSSLLVGTEARCWRKYKTLAGAMEENALQTAMYQALMELVEPILKGAKGY